ncbi:MAG: TIGR03546 family protein [Spirochaetaceae bacterium]|nr:TIGR03546 family protein [Spirochaetaceae bacterium]
MLSYVFSLFSALNKNSHPGDIAHGIALGVAMAIVPKDNLLWPVLFASCIFIKKNTGAFFLSFFLFGFLSPFCDIIIERLGFWVLSISALQPVYSFLDTVPFIGLTKFYNTMVAGGIVFSAILYIPIYVIVRLIVRLYRKKVGYAFSMLEESASSHFLSKFPLLRYLEKLNSIKDFFNK